jgi:RNA polymerase sigma-70 factor (ECF subfamily)
VEQVVRIVARAASITDTRVTPEELCRRHADRVYRFATMVADDKNQADDLAQEALERAIRGLDGFEQARGTLDSWLFRIVVNCARDAGRMRTRESALLDRTKRLFVRAVHSPYQVPSGVHDLDLLSAVRQLDPRQRALIGLRFGADLEYQEVGRVLGISSSAATVATHRALAALRGKLEAIGRTGVEK